MAGTVGCNHHGAPPRAAAACMLPAKAACQICPGEGSTQRVLWLAGLDFTLQHCLSLVGGKKWCEKRVRVPLSWLHDEMLSPFLLVRDELWLLTGFPPPPSFWMLFMALGKQMGLGFS